MINKSSWRRYAFILGILGSLQFIVLTLLAMVAYSGGTIHHPEWESYSFLYNYFSDLGRTRTFDGTPNNLSQNLFKTALTIGGICLIAFFVALPGLFRNGRAKGLAVVAAALGLLSGSCYIAIAHLPWNLEYWAHTYYVRTGFIAFLGMTIFYSGAILWEPDYPRKYARAFGLFGIILFVQIAIMLLGPRAYVSDEALFLQAVAQKVVVYAEIVCMLYQSWGALVLAVRSR